MQGFGNLDCKPERRLVHASFVSAYSGAGRSFIQPYLNPQLVLRKTRPLASRA